MNASKVQKLEALLSRVRARSAEPRPVRVVATPAAGSVTEPQEVLSLLADEEEDPALGEATAFAATPASSAHGPAPLSLAPPPGSSPAAASSDDLSDESFGDLSFDSEPARAAPAASGRLRSITLPEAVAPVMLNEPESRIEHHVPQATGPVARSEGHAPPRAALSFEELIARSLSLRPRD